MTYLDAAGLMALLLGEAGSADVEAVLREGTVRMTAVNYAEVVDQMTRVQGASASELHAVLEPLFAREVLAIVDVDASIGGRAGAIRSSRCDRLRCPVSLADCVLLAAAGLAAGAIATSDQPLADAAGAEGVAVRPLRNSRGVRPTVGS